MWSIFCGLLVVTISIFAVIAVSIFTAIAIKGLIKLMKKPARSLKKFAIKPVKDLKELAAATIKAIQEVWQKRSFKGLSEDSYIVLFVWLAATTGAVTYLSLVIYFGVDRIGYTVLVLAVSCSIFLVLFVYIFFIALKAGQEKIVEQLAFFNIVLIVALIIAVVWDELLESKSSIEIVRTIAMIVAGAVGLLALTIAFLNYKRKSGVAIRCNIVFDNGDRAFNLYFSNLKDKSIVIYSFAIERDNLVLEQVPERPIILGAYGVQVFRLKKELLFFNQTDTNANSGYVDNEVFEVPILLYSHIVHGEIQIRAMTEKGEILVDVRSIPDLSLLKDIVLRQTDYSLSQIYANRNSVKTKTLYGEKIADIEKSMFLLRKKDDAFILVEKPKISEKSNKTEYNQGN